MTYSVGDVVHVYGTSTDLDGRIGMIVEKTCTRERTFDPDRRVTISKYGVMSLGFPRIVFLRDVFLKPLSCMSSL